MEQIIGIDLAKRVFQVHIVALQGEKKANKMLTREKLMAFIAQQPPSRIVMEACGSANYWACVNKAVVALANQKTVYIPKRSTFIE